MTKLTKHPTLYHGTDMRILRMSMEERQNIKKKCIEAIDYMWQYLKPYNETIHIQKMIKQSPLPVTVVDIEFIKYRDMIDSKEPYLYCNIIDAITCNNARMNNNKAYSYDHTFLTNNRERAISYAHKAWKFGEIGQIAYRFSQALDIICPEGWNPPQKIHDTIEWIWSFVNEKEQPVIIEVNNYDLDNLYLQNGSPAKGTVFLNDDVIASFYYTEEMYFSPQNAIVV